MPRQKKARPVGDPVRDDVLGVEVQIYLNPNTLDFFADFESQHFEADAADKVRAEVATALRGARNLTWIPVIQVAEPRTFGSTGEFDDVSLGFTLGRYWAARKGNGYWLRSPWEYTDDKDRLTYSFNLGVGNKDLEFPAVIGHSTARCTRSASSEEVWTALVKIQEALKAARARFQEMIGTAEGLERLTRATLPQLTAGYGSEEAGGPYAKYIKGGIATSADLMDLEEGEVCPDCKRPFKSADVVDFEDYLDTDDYCQTCGMLWTNVGDWEITKAPPDPTKAVELSSWDYRALKLIFDNPGKLTEGDWNGIAHLAPDLKDRGLIVFDAAAQPFLTPKGINSLREADPNKDSNPPLELAPGGGGMLVLRPQAAPVQIQPLSRPQGRVQSRGGAELCEVCHGTGLADKDPKGHFYSRPVRCWAFDCSVNDRPLGERSPAPFDSPYAHNEGCPKRWGGAACLCNALDADDARE